MIQPVVSSKASYNDQSNDQSQIFFSLQLVCDKISLLGSI